MSASARGGDVSAPTLHGALVRWAHERPDAAFIVEVDTGRSLTYAEALREVQQLQVWLGDRERRIAVSLPGGIELAVLWLAALTGGHLLIPCPTDTTSAELGDLHQRWSPDLYVAPDAGSAMSAAAPDVQTVAGETLRHLLQSAALGAAPTHCGREGALALTTSGTTGEPKGICLRADQIAWTADRIRLAHELTADDRGLAVLPFYHINAPVVSLCTTLLAGATVVIAPRFSLSRFWGWVERECVTWASIVPTLVALLLQSDTPVDPPPSLRFIRTASAPLPAAHLRAFERRFGVPLIETYGLSEAASTVTANSVPPGRHKPGSVGMPLRGLALRVCRPVDEAEPGTLRDVQHGEEGEICVRAPSVIARYEGAANDTAFIDGWFRTGDLGYQDRDGYVFLTGRLRDIINFGGHKIAPREVEEVLLAHPAVSEAAVVGQPDPVYGERVAAYVVPDRSLSSVTGLGQALRSYCAQRLNAYKIPQNYSVVARLPRTATGKVRRHLLALAPAGANEDGPWEHASA